MAAVALAGSRRPRAGGGLAQSFVSLFAVVSRIAALVVLCGAGFAVLLAIVYVGSGLQGPWLAIWGILTMAAAVGLLFGFAVASLNAGWKTVALVLLLCLVPTIALGGRLSALSELSLPLRLAAGATPSRWAFEGALLLESPHHQPPAADAESGSGETPDLAEAFFPAASEQMGTQADAMALGLMLIGLVAAIAVNSIQTKPVVAGIDEPRRTPAHV